MRARWIPLLLAAAISMPRWVQAQSQDRFALTEPEVARALSDSGIQIAGGQVSLLTRVVATEPSPKLDIVSVERLGKGSPAERLAVRVRVKLACDLPGKCLPFYAIVSSPQTTAGPASDPSIASPAFRTAGSNPNNEITMRAGAHATLMMDDQRAHIQVTVISLENGTVGRRIHVATPDHKQTYVGEVVSARLLKGSF
jgi:hypothetical protein